MDRDSSALIKEAYATSVLKALMDEVSSGSTLDEEAFKQMIEKVKKSTGERGKKLFMPIRCALTGRTEGIEIAKILTILGRVEVLKRLDGAIRTQV